MIECRNVSKKYSNIPVLEKLNFQIPQQKCYGFLGQNGAGKTTTLRILVGLLHPDDGEVLIKGHSVTRERSTMQRLCGYLPQSPSFYPWLTGDRRRAQSRGRLALE